MESYEGNNYEAENRKHEEGRTAKSIEQQTAKLPSDSFLWVALGAIGTSLALQISGKDKAANFVGHWVPTVLILGVYNKLVKLHGSEGKPSSEQMGRYAT